MNAIFIGQDGSMNRRYGEVYDVRIYSQGSYIWVECGLWRCPYSSIAALAANWETAMCRGIKN